MNIISRWYNKKFSKIVRVGDEWGIRRRTLPFFTSEYLDLDSIKGGNSIEGGSMYSAPDYAKKKPKIHWWNQPDTIRKYALSDDLDQVVDAYEKLGCFVPATVEPLPKAEPVEDIAVEIAQYKLSGGRLRKKFDYAE